MHVCGNTGGGTDEDDAPKHTPHSCRERERENPVPSCNASYYHKAFSHRVEVSAVPRDTVEREMPRYCFSVSAFTGNKAAKSKAELIFFTE